MNSLGVENEKLREKLAKGGVDRKAGGVAAENEKLREKLAECEKTFKAHDNQHTPPSKKTITRREINKQKKEEGRKNNPAGRRGLPAGHKGASARRKAERTERRTPGKCDSCGGTDLKVVKVVSEMETDIPPLPKAVTTCHTVETCECQNCGDLTESKMGMVKGTSLGPNLLSEAVEPWGEERRLRGHSRFAGRKVRR